jgi:hypothetical protein
MEQSCVVSSPENAEEDFWVEAAAISGQILGPTLVTHFSSWR